MLSLEKLANANIKNRAEYTQLSTELNRLEKEKQNELKMVNNEIQRFKAKYSKTNFSTDSPEASNVKMYDTHNPGFCFRRNGEHRAQQVVERTPSIDFEHLHFLLFTDGEVDIEKILCLHLLSSHETSHLAPPRRPRTSGTFTKKDSPLEQLIERSEDSSKETVLQPILPTYVLDVNKGNPKRTLMDERLSSRLLVNEKILELITTVITALEHSNPEKVKHLISLAQDASRLKRIFRKQHIQDFVMTLKDFSLVNSCSSFILTQPQKLKACHLEIRTPSGALEDLVTYIHTNVLQFPKRESFELEVDSRELVNIETHTPFPTKISKTFSKEQSLVIKQQIYKEPVVAPPRKPVQRRDVDYIQRNIDYVSTIKRNSLEQETVLPKTKKRKTSTDSNIKKNESKEETGSTSSKTQNDTTGKNRKMSSESAKERKGSLLSDKTKRSSIDKKSRRVSIDMATLETCEEKPEDKEEIKVHLKQTTCQACMEKWKQPLPEPKVPRLSLNSPENSTERFFFKPVIKTDSRRRVKNLIDKEQYKLVAYDRKYSNTSTSSNQSKRKSSVQSDSFDLVALNILDLEKIRHEIREKETQKKLEKFLGS